jgi:triosephosphate isomerase (TIM)
MRKKLVVGNWKMNKNLDETAALIGELIKTLENKIKGVEIVVCPQFPSLPVAHSLLKESRIGLGAQNLSQYSDGAYTGEVAGAMLRSVGCKYVIVGHSERRQYFKESDELVNAKIKSALKECLIPIVCVGETLAEREAGSTHTVVTEQVEGAFRDLKAEDLQKTMIAYEPVWAIGTGKTATPEQANDVHKLIREIIRKKYSIPLADEMIILYGGSVNAQNALSLFSQPDIDGGLVGGASLKSETFTAIAQGAADASHFGK